MTARTSSYNAPMREGKELPFPMLAAEICYKGAPVFADASSGYAQSNDGDTITLAAGDVFLGIAKETCDNSAGANGAKSVIVHREGVFYMPIAGTPSVAKIGDPVYVNNVSDDSTLTLTSDSGNQEVRVGTLVGYDGESGYGWVDITRHVGNLSAQAA